ncbi:hypothetical protein XFF1815_220051 [Xanthomonas citri pv. fuscans]|nr:hypothetical protein XFF6960_860049 [Xanthomonas citri pv. fuscans]SOO15779.1 hypothetical protein XFF7766_620051 [Xanthomonas citri pv. fuscans]SOO42599.1 hypothetical protein XFF1815_220051 [Xanthomonas citri pv. fuscans]
MLKIVVQAAPLMHGKRHRRLNLEETTLGQSQPAIPYR